MSDLLKLGLSILNIGAAVKGAQIAIKELRETNRVLESSKAKLKANKEERERSYQALLEQDSLRRDAKREAMIAEIAELKARPGAKTRRR
jgi:hypothetical protein